MPVRVDVADRDVAVVPAGALQHKVFRDVLRVVALRLVEHAAAELAAGRGDRDRDRRDEAPRMHYLIFSSPEAREPRGESQDEAHKNCGSPWKCLFVLCRSLTPHVVRFLRRLPRPVSSCFVRLPRPFVGHRGQARKQAKPPNFGKASLRRESDFYAVSPAAALHKALPARQKRALAAARNARNQHWQ